MPEKLTTSNTDTRSPRDLELRHTQNDSEYNERRLAAVKPFVDSYTHLTSVYQREGVDGLVLKNDQVTDGLEDVYRLAQEAEQETYIQGEAHELTDSEHAVLDHVAIKASAIEAQSHVDLEAFYTDHDSVEKVLADLETKLWDAVQKNDTELIDLYAYKIDSFESMISVVEDDGTVTGPDEDIAHKLISQSEYMKNPDEDDEDGEHVLEADKKVLEDANDYYQRMTSAYESTAAFFPRKTNSAPEAEVVAESQPQIESVIGRRVIAKVIDEVSAPSDALEFDAPAAELKEAASTSDDDELALRRQKLETEIASISRKLGRATARKKKKDLRRPISKRKRLLVKLDDTQAAS